MPGPRVTPPSAPAAGHLEAVRRRLAVIAARAAPAPAMLIRHYRFSPGQAPGWQVLRQRHLVPQGRAGVMRLTQVTVAATEDPARVLKLEVYETASGDAARALLVELLTAFQVLPEQMTISQGVGEADIALPGDRVRLFTRGNLVVVLADAGPQAQPVGALAAGFDAFFTAAPAAPSVKCATVKRAAASPGTASEGPPMLKFVAAAGALRQLDDGTLVVEGSDQPPTALVLDADDDTWRPSDVSGGEDGAPAPARPRPPRPKR